MTRVHTLARELGITSKDILAKCRGEGLDVKNHMAILSAGVEAAIREWFAGPAPKAVEEQPAHVDLLKAHRRPRRKILEPSPESANRAVVAPPIAEVPRPSSRAPEVLTVDPQDLVGKALRYLAQGLGRFVEVEMKTAHGDRWETVASQTLSQERSWARTKGKTEIMRDPQDLLVLVWKLWSSLFGRKLGHRERSLISELREDRKRWAHNDPVGPTDAFRSLHSVSLLLSSISANAEVGKIRGLMKQLIPLLQTEYSAGAHD